MQALSVSQRIAPSVGEMEPGTQKTPFDMLYNTYASINLSTVNGRAGLILAINNPKRPVCIAMTVAEVREIAEQGLESRRPDINSWLDELDPNVPVVLEPYGSDIKQARGNREHLLDIASTGMDFPEIDDLNVTPMYFGKGRDGSTTTIAPAPDHYDLIAQMLQNQGVKEKKLSPELETRIQHEINVFTGRAPYFIHERQELTNDFANEILRGVKRYNREKNVWYPADVTYDSIVAAKMGQLTDYALAFGELPDDNEFFQRDLPAGDTEIRFLIEDSDFNNAAENARLKNGKTQQGFSGNIVLCPVSGDTMVKRNLL